MPARPPVLAALLVLAACRGSEGDDPLDPDLIEDIAQGAGDGQGDRYSGRFVFSGVPRDCACAEDGFSLCGGLADFALLDGEFDIIHADGYLTISPKSAAGFSTLSGSVDEDGGFATGAIYDASTVATALTVYVRFEGDFTDPDGLAGEFQYRVVGEVTGEPADCRATASIEARRRDEE